MFKAKLRTTFKNILSIITCSFFMLFNSNVFADTTGIHDQVDLAVMSNMTSEVNNTQSETVVGDVEEPSNVLCTLELTDLLYSQKFKHVTQKDEIVKTICVNSKKYDISYKVVSAIIYTESTFKINAKNGPNIGLMQVNSRYHKVKGLATVIGNITYGVQFIRELVNETGSMKKAISRYNGGSNNVKYVNKILQAEKKLFS